MFIVIVEDDFLQEGPLEQHLYSAFPAATIETLCTESECREKLSAYRQHPPDVVIMDVMLRWASPSPNAPAPPPDVVAGDYFRAGLRCAELMSRDEKLSQVPVIVYTILERSDLERDGERLPAVSYVRKSADLDILTRKVRELTSNGRRRRSMV
jgi:DNA-binding NarL/FixJ family response regulator